MPADALVDQPGPSPQHSTSRLQHSGALIASNMVSPGKMLKIHSLLNPEEIPTSPSSQLTSPATTNITTDASVTGPSTRQGTPIASAPTKKPKLVKDAPMFVHGTPLEPVNFEPFESDERALTLNTAEHHEMRHQHERFSVWPTTREGNGGRIRDYVKHIPYSSEKKGFFTSTGRQGFEGMSYCRGFGI